MRCGVMVIDWYLRCPKCGFEFSVLFNSDETEENKKIIRECPCGNEMEIVKEKKGGEQG